jgi:SAM-dependent methyltransferase
MTIRGVIAALVLTVGCSKPPAAEDRARGSGAAPAAAPVADGVLAEVAGASGPIRVEQKAGRRLLVIGDTVHASVPWTASGPDPAAVDPLVALLRAVRPAAKTALVIGLGSGDTAGDLARAGLAVTAVEIDPQVIEVARRWFGYQGNAEAGDGRAFLESHPGPWDVVLMDAFAGTKPPPKLVDAAGTKLLRERTTKGGVTALRLHGAPADPAVTGLLRGLRAGTATFVHAYGSGVGGEEQNLYVIASDTPLNQVAPGGAALWPIPDDPAALQSLAPGATSAEPAPTRDVTLVGYVHRLGSGELALDLPHAEMGAVRYLLTGAAAGSINVPVGATFPTAGDIASDGDTAATLRPLLGGGGAKRSDVRFSPVVAAVGGTARLLAVVHPDAASKVPRPPGDVVVDDRIPYGGALYELAVDRVLWTVDRAGWSAGAAALDKTAASAGTAAARGELAAAARDLEVWADAMGKRLGEHSELVPAVAAARALATAMPGEAERARAKGTDFATGAACDRLRHRYGQAAPPPVAAGLYQCAVSRYQRAAAGKDRAAADTYDAAARLVFLLGDAPDEQAAERQRRDLMKKFAIGQPMMFPPGLP